MSLKIDNDDNSRIHLIYIQFLNKFETIFLNISHPKNINILSY